MVEFVMLIEVMVVAPAVFAMAALDLV